MAAANYVTVTPALAELIRYALLAGAPRTPLLTSRPVHCLKRKSRSSFAAPSAASWQSTRSKHPAASRCCAKTVRLLVVAVVSACCASLITRAGTSTLPTTCPVCEHTPVSVDDCKPNNKLRMTTRAFLKTAEKKRDSAQTKEPTPATPLTPVDPKPSVTPAPAPAVQEAAPEPAVAEMQEREQSAAVNGPVDPDPVPAAATDAEPPPATEEEVRLMICITPEYHH